MKKDQKKLNKKKEKKYYDTFYGDNEQEINSYNTVPIWSNIKRDISVEIFLAF